MAEADAPFSEAGLSAAVAGDAAGVERLREDHGEGPGTAAGGQDRGPAHGAEAAAEAPARESK